jgi:predicted esterase
MSSGPIPVPARRRLLRTAGFPAFAAVLLLTAARCGIRRTPSPALSLDDTGMADFTAGDFDGWHSPADPEAGEYVVFGNLSPAAPAADVPADYAAFLGRWEGYGHGPPVDRDWKFVLAVREITREGGKAFLWAGTTLQYPVWIKEIAFRFAAPSPLRMEWRYAEGAKSYLWTWTHDPRTDVLHGRRTETSSGADWIPVELDRGRSFRVYRDYPARLAADRIRPVAYRDGWLVRYYGPGFLLYLPEGYGEDPGRVWPMILSLHGSGDRGDNLFLLAKTGPLAMVREQGPLPFLVVAPLLGDSADYPSFPEPYLDGVLEQVLGDYRVDRTRIYGTGLSMGGEALYRYAVHRPDLFAAIAPISAYLASTAGLERIAGLPVRVIHGAEDPVVPLSMARQDVEALIGAGADVSFIILEHHDHDAWTDTYRDPLFYRWLLSHAGA